VPITHRTAKTVLIGSGWLLAWGLLGLVGDWALARSWRAWQVEELQRSLRVVAELVRGDRLTEPWESDPGWQQLERQLNADLVPQMRVADGVESEPPQWTQLASGQWRVSLVAALAEPHGSVAGIQATRVLTDSATRGIWWSCWATLGGLLTAGWLVSARLRGQVEEDWRAVLEPWQRIATTGVPTAAMTASGAAAGAGAVIGTATGAFTGAGAVARRGAAATDSDATYASGMHASGVHVSGVHVSGVTGVGVTGVGVGSGALGGSLRAEPAELPPVQQIAHPAAPTLAAVRARVNGWLAELRLDKTRNELVLGNLREGILAVDQLGRVLLINPALRQQFEIAAENYVLRPIVEVLRQPRVINLIETVLASRRGMDETLEIGTPKRHLRLIGAPLPLGSEDCGVLVTVVDNTPLEQSELARRDFIAGASHELKTPLAAIRAYAETLQVAIGDDPEAAQRFLGCILDQADRMNHLVNSMLQLARVESGGLLLRRERIDAVAALGACLDATARLAASKGVAFEPELPAGQVWLWGDRDAYQTIASNLLSNAVRYTPAGGAVRVAIEVAGPWVVLRVSDTGIGIAEDDQQRIFERFFRVQKDRAAESGGTGLGLAIVKQLVHSLKGEIQVRSRPGEGARFEVRLPGVGFTQSSSIAASQALATKA
jgi:two-component system, OmpR family, phosphate regulon sensor histidine kinase PhoR